MLDEVLRLAAVVVLMSWRQLVALTFRRLVSVGGGARLCVSSSTSLIARRDDKAATRRDTTRRDATRRLTFSHFTTATVRRSTQWRFHAGAAGGGHRPPKSWLGTPKFSRTFNTLCGQVILRKVATRCHILRLKCTKFDFRWGSAQTLLGELTVLPKPPNCI